VIVDSQYMLQVIGGVVEGQYCVSGLLVPVIEKTR